MGPPLESGLLSLFLASLNLISTITLFHLFPLTFLKYPLHLRLYFELNRKKNYDFFASMTTVPDKILLNLNE